VFKKVLLALDGSALAEASRPCIVSQLKAKGVEAFYDIVSGDPAEKILDCARNKRCNLIAISTHGRSGIVRWALGSVANKILHETDIPLLLVRAPEAACPVPEAK